MTENIMQTDDILTDVIDNLRAAVRAYRSEARKHPTYSTPNGTYHLAAITCELAAEKLVNIQQLIEGLEPTDE